MLDIVCWAKLKKINTFLVRISIKKRAGEHFFFVIYYFLLHAFFTHYNLPPGALRSNISKTKHQILIKHKFDTHKGLTVKINIILVYTQQQWALQVMPVGFCS